MQVEHKFSNKNLAFLLKEVLAAMEVKQSNRFKIRAYQNAITSIEDLTISVQDLWESKKLSEIPGVGGGLAAHLHELFTTGKVSEWVELTKDLPQGMFSLLTLRGVGAKTAYKLATNFNLNSRDDAFDKVKKLAQSGEIQKLPGFGEKSEKELLSAIEDLKKSKNEKQRTLLIHAEEIAGRVVDYMRQCPDVLEIHPLGSLRRRAPTVGDIDLTVSTNSNSTVISHFCAFSEVSEIISRGDKMVSAVLSNGVQVDLLCTEPSSLGSMLQHFTGSKQHNVLLRTHALERGYSLSQYGIKSAGKLLDFADERSFYNFLGLDTVPVELREGMDEIELAKKRNMPDLVTVEEIKGDLHMHTVLSDGLSTIKEMVDRCKLLGYLYIGISDHSPSVQSRGSYDVLGIMERTKSIIEQLNSSPHELRVLFGYEVNILVDNRMSMPDNMLANLNYVIGSVHTSLDQDEEIMTSRLLSAIRNPYVNIIGHPTNRLINEREPVNVDWDKVLDEAKEFDKILEINSQPTRLDLSEDLVREAIKRGVKIIINTDAHSANDLDLMRYGVDVARRSGCTPGNIINTLTFDEFVKAANIRL